MMRINPEIRRNLWLEFSTHRAIAMPVALCIIFYIASQTYIGSNVSELGSASIMVFFFLVKLWGGQKAAESVIDEVNENTWDFQKLSALSPWSLTFGKLFGSTAYCWYGGLIAIAAAIISSVPFSPLDKVCIGGALLLLSGLITQAMALFSSLLTIQNRSGARNRLRAFPHMLIGIVVGDILSPSNILNWWLGSRAANIINASSITWYGHEFDRLGFYAVVALIAFAWIIGGIYWQMRGQMKMRTGPSLWLGFVIFIIILFSGLSLLPDVVETSKIIDFHGLIPFIISLTCLYLIAFQETWNIMRYRRMVSAWQDRNYERAVETCPRWLPTFFLTLCTAVYVGFSDPAPSSIAFMVGLLFFAIRDLAILHFFKLSPTSRRPHQATIFYLGVLYLIMPFLFGVFHADSLKGLWLVWPFGEDQKFVFQGLISGIAQAGIAVLLMVWRWYRYGRTSI